jgi:hypothetical protein
MPLRPCLGRPGQPCSRLTDRTDSRCTTCASATGRARDAARGSRHDRGYGAEHDRTRAALLERLVPGTACPRCGEPMWSTQDLDAGHSTPLRTDRTSRADRLEHARCNRSGLGDSHTP